ncbi:CDP-6-deoxy-delta-3,4-glucoseen reductase, partial [mine drainage metagenome]
MGFSARAGGLTRVMPDHTFGITLQPSADHYPAEASQTILQALERGGLEFPAFCRHGHCGLCRARLLSGTLAPEDRTQPAHALIEEGEILICTSRPGADLELCLFWGPGRAPEIPARVTRIESLATGIHRLVLRLPVVQPFTFAPGQFVLLRLAGLVRAYALANPPHERDPELHIQSTRGTG